MFSAPSSTYFEGIRWDAADAAGRERAYGTCGGAGVGEDAQRRGKIFSRSLWARIAELIEKAKDRDGWRKLVNDLKPPKRKRRQDTGNNNDASTGVRNVDVYRADFNANSSAMRRTAPIFLLGAARTPGAVELRVCSLGG